MILNYCTWQTFIMSSGFRINVTCPVIIKTGLRLKPQVQDIFKHVTTKSSYINRRWNILSNWSRTVNYQDLNKILRLYNQRLFHLSVSLNCGMHSVYGSSVMHQTFTCNICHPFANYNVTFRLYSNNKNNNINNNNKKTIANRQLSFKRHEYIRGVLQEKQKRIKQTRQQFQRRGKLILEDIRETKSRMKVKMEEIIERENIWTVPNLLCVTRIGMSPYLGYLIMQENYNLALGLVIFAGVTDLLDGIIARSFKSQCSKLGSFLDPMADKILIATLFLTLTLSGNIPVPLTVLIVTRDVALFGAGCYIRYQSLPPPRTLSRYFDMTHATAQLAPTTLSKINTMIQLLTVFSTLGAVVFEHQHHPALYTLWCVTAGSTVASALSYLMVKDTYKILKKRSTK